MRRFLVLIAVLLAACLVAGCNGVSAASDDLSKGVTKTDAVLKEADTAFISSQYSFASELFKASYNESKGKNTLVSPLSVMLALSMTANGANGDTLAEMESVLGDTLKMSELNSYLRAYTDSLPSGKGGKAEIANSIWFRDTEGFTVKNDFLQKNADYYGASVYKSPFNKTTLKDINGWVKKNTDGMIDRILDEISPATMMYLINALCFKAEWEEIYEDISIRDGKFTSLSGQSRDVEMMSSTESLYIKTDDATGFIKYYKDRDYAFAAVLPNEGTDITDYINSLTGEKLTEILNNTVDTTVYARIPKFETEFSATLNDILRNMGMKKAFDDSADFSGISEDIPLYIGQVLHKTYIKVDEKGTEAGAVTVVAMDAGSSYIPEYVTVDLDRPFVYMIIDCKNKLPIFFGAVSDIE